MDKKAIDELGSIADEMGLAIRNLIVISNAIGSDLVESAVMSDALTYVVMKISELHLQLDALAFPMPNKKAPQCWRTDEA